MPRFTGNTALRPELGQLAEDYALEQSRQKFIGLQIMPLFPVSEQSGTYPVIPIESLLKVQDTNRAPRSGYNRGDFDFDSRSYACVEHGFEESLDDAEANLFRRFFDAEEIAVRRATDILLRDQERRIAAAVMNTSNAGAGTNAATAAWDVAANAKPAADVAQAKIDMLNTTGIEPNVAVMSQYIFEKVMLCNELTGRMQYTGPVELLGVEAKKKLLAAYLGVDMVLVGSSIVDSAAKGKTKVIAPIWSESYVALLRVSTGGMDLKEPSFGRTFLWTGDSASNLVVEQYRDEPVRSNIYRVRHNTQEAVTFTGASFIITGVKT